jgi:hypothetical protein
MAGHAHHADGTHGQHRQGQGIVAAVDRQRSPQSSRNWLTSSVLPLAAL